MTAAGAVAGRADRPARVLVEDNRRERPDAVTAVFDGLGIHLVDSPWAATVATSPAEADGEPYDAILVDEGMTAVHGAAGAL